MSDIEEIKKTVLAICSQHHPDIPAGLIEAVLDIEAQFAMDRSETFRRLSQVIENYVNSQESLK